MIEEKEIRLVQNPYDEWYMIPVELADQFHKDTEEFSNIELDDKRFRDVEADYIDKYIQFYTNGDFTLIPDYYIENGYKPIMRL